MPNNSYLRSRRREWELMHRLRDEGYQACRSAGSHSEWDVWAFHPEFKIVRLIQIKTKKSSRDLIVKDHKEYFNVRVETETYSYE